MHEIRLIATKLGIQKLDATINSITLAFIDKPPIEPLRIILLLQKLKTCKYDGKSKLIWSIKSETTEDKVKHIHLILNELNG